MRPDGEALSEPENAQREKAEMEAEERETDVGAPSAMHDEAAERDEPAGEREVVAPLSRRDPRAGEHEQREEDAEVSRIEDVLAAHAEHELRADRDHRGERMRPEVVGAKQQREAEPGDQCTPGPRLRLAAPTIADLLRQPGGGEREQALLGVDREVSQPRAGREQQSQRRDLKDSRVAIRHAHVLAMENAPRALSCGSA